MYVFILFYFIFYVQLREIDIFKESLIIWFKLIARAIDKWSIVNPLIKTQHKNA